MNAAPTSAMPPTCVTCRHHQRHHFGLALCRAARKRWSPVDGWHDVVSLCDRARAPLPRGDCGPDGLWYERLPTWRDRVQRLVETVFRWNNGGARL